MAPRKKNVHRLVLTEKKASHQSDQQFRLDFYGTELNVIITHEDETIGRWISEVRHNSRRFLKQRRRIFVGLSFGSNQTDSISTIHLSVARKCIIIQLHRLLEHRKAPVPAILSDFFSDKRVMFVGINNGRQARILQSFGIATDQIYDLCNQGNENASYKEILVNSGINCEFDLSPQITNRNWSKTNLDKNQISQAAAEAFMSLKIGIKLF